VCYICLDGGDVLRGCACRGASAGFAHVDCLAEMAARDEWMTIEGRADVSRWGNCCLCRQMFSGALAIHMARRWWRRSRDAPDSDEKRQALGCVGSTLRLRDEFEAAERLDEESTRGLANDDPDVLLNEITRAYNRNRQNPAALFEALHGLRARVARCGHGGVRATHAHALAYTLRDLGRPQEALACAAESVELATSDVGAESPLAFISAVEFARVLASVGRVQEARAELSRVLATQTRVLGADHDSTRETRIILGHLGGPTADGLFPSVT